MPEKKNGVSIMYREATPLAPYSKSTDFLFAGPFFLGHAGKLCCRFGHFAAA